MKIQQLIEERDVFLGLAATGVDEALEQIAERLAERRSLPADDVATALRDRERLGTTGVGDGFAIPHCKLTGLSEMVVGVTRFDRPIDFGAADEKPVDVFFVVVSPPEQPAAHLQVLSQIARILKRAAVREELRSAEAAADVVAAVRKAAESEGV